MADSRSSIGSDSPSNSSSDKPQRRRIHRPAKNSLYDLFHRHARTSLFVRPICWTDLHAKLLGTQWEKLPPCDSPKPDMMPGMPPSKGHLRPSHTITTLSDSLTQILLPDAIDPSVCSDAVETIMWNFPSDEAKSSYSSFRSVSTRPVDSFNAPTHPCTPSLQGPANLPMMCYIGKSQLANIHRDPFRNTPGPGRSSNEPVERLQQLRARQLVPANSDHNAHFIGIFLTMAQKHFYPPPSPLEIPLSPNFQDVTLRILTHDTNTSDFIVYTAYVTKKFLQKFHDPFKAPQEPSGIRIEFARVPIWPILGLRERLGRALGRDVVGQFNHEEIETWEQDPETQDDDKRKREVLNSSSDEESGNGPTLGRKKRCLSEGSPVGVVM